MRRRIISILLVLAMLASCFPMNVMALGNHIALNSEERAYLVDGDQTFSVLTFTVEVPKAFNAMEFTIEQNPHYTVDKVVCEGLELSAAKKLATVNGLGVGVLNIDANGNWQLAFSKFEQGEWQRPLNVTLHLTAKNQTTTHVVEAALAVSDLTLLDANGENVTLDAARIDGVDEQFIFTKTISDQLALTNQLINALPDVANVTLDHENLVAGAQAEYVKLLQMAEFQDNIVRNQLTNYANLIALNAKIDELKQAAFDVNTAIQALPAVADVVESQQTAVNDAKMLFDALTLSQQKYVTDVNKAKLADLQLQLSKISTAKNVFVAAINKGVALKNAAVVGDRIGNTSQSNLDALNTAITAANTFSAGIAGKKLAEIDQATNSINTATASYNQALVTELGAKKTDLKNLITAAKAVHNQAQEGTLEGQYPVGSKAKLLTVIATAEAVFANADSTMAQVSDAFIKLDAEKTKFEALKLTALDVAKKKLATRITEAESLLTTSQFGPELNQYPLESKALLQEGIGAARSTDLTNPATALDNANAAFGTLNTVISQFEATKITSVVLLKQSVAKLFTDGNRTALAPTVVQKSISDLKTAVEALGASQDKTDMLAHLVDAQNLFDKPFKVMVYADGNGIGNLEINKTQQLKSEVYNSLNIKLTNTPVAWTSNDDSIATVSAAGLVTAKAEGKVKITATVEGQNPPVFKESIISVFKAPDLVVSNIPKGAHYSKAVTVMAYRDGKNITIKNGVTTVATGTSTASATFTLPGSYTINFTSDEGGTPASAQLTFVIDTTAPVITMPNINSVVDGVVTIPEVTYQDNQELVDSTKALYLEKKVGATYAYLTNTVKDALVKEAGDYKLVAFVKDKAGNEAKVSKEFSVTLDMNKPTISITGVQALNAQAVTPVVALNGGTNKNNYYYVGILTKPSGTQVQFSSSAPLGQQADSGQYTLEVNAFNPNNLNVFASQRLEFTIDKLAPAISIVGVENNGLYNATVMPIIVVSDPEGIDTDHYLNNQVTVSLKKAGQSLAYVKGSPVSSEGVFTLVAEVTDSAAKKATASVQFTIDKTKPTITLSNANLLDGSVYYDQLTSNIVTDNDAEFESITINGNNVNLSNDKKSAALTFAKVNGVATTYTLLAQAKDLAGNKTSKKLTLVVDAIPVKFEVTGLKEGAVVAQLPNNITAQVVDGANTSAVVPTYTRANGDAFDGSDGPQKMSLSYVKGQTTYTKDVNFIIDSTSPAFTENNLIVKKGDNAQNGNFLVKAGDKIAITADVSDATSDVVSVYANVGSYLTQVPLTKETNNTYKAIISIDKGNAVAQTLKIYAVDTAGNIGLQTAMDITIDNNAPGVNLTMIPTAVPNGSNGYYVSNAMKLILGSNDANAVIKYILNGGQEATYTQGFSPAQGLNALAYFAQDLAGNTSAQLSSNFLYDSLKPAQVTNFTLGDFTTVNEKSITFTAEVANEANKGTKVYVEQNGNIVALAEVLANDLVTIKDLKLVEGSNHFTLYAKDIAGNISDTVNKSIQADTIKPVFEIVQVDSTNYTVTRNEVIDGSLSVVFNGTPVDANNIALNGNVYSIETPSPIEGQNLLVVTGKDGAGNIGSGSMSTNYLPPDVAQDDVQVADGTTLDIPAGAFSGTTLLTVQSVDIEGDTSYKSLGSPIKYSFTEKPTQPIVISTFVGTGLTGVGIIHISDSGEADEFVAALTVSPIDFNNLIEDQPYYDPNTGMMVLRTKNFSTYQMGQDNASPIISVTTTDFDIQFGQSSTISATLTDQDANAKFTKVVIDGVETSLNQATLNNYALNLSEGNHEVTLYAQDTANNSASITKVYVVDTIKPVLNASAVAATTDQENGQINLNLSELSELSVNDQVVGSANGVTSLNVDLSLDNGGVNTFVLKATDQLGNMGTQTVVINRIAAMTLSVDAIADTTAETVSITGNVNVTSNVFVNEVQKLSNQSGNFTITNYPLALGSNTLVVKAIDANGNEKSQTITVTRNAANNGNNGNNGNNNGGVVIPGGTTDANPTVVNPAAPKVVTSLGGSVEFKDLGISMNFDVNTFTGKSDVLVSEVKIEKGQIVFQDGKNVATELQSGTAKLKLAGKVFEFTSTEKLAKPVAITFSYDPKVLTAAEIETLGVYYLNQKSGQWEYMHGVIDTVRNTITVELDHFSIYAIMTYQKSFADVANHWAKSYIEYLAGRHIIAGSPQDQYEPNKNMTRAEFATIIVKALGITMTEAKGQFKDVATSAWYAKAIEAAKANGIVSGYPTGYFKPDAPVTRQEVAAMIMNAYNYINSVNYKNVYTQTKTTFNDDASIESWAKQAVQGAKALGIIGGKGDNLFDPKANATKAEVAKMIYSLLKGVK